MKVLHVTPSYFAEASIIGGGERYVHNVNEALCLQSSVSQSDILSFGPRNRDIKVNSKSTLRIAEANAVQAYGETEAYANSRIPDFLAEYDVIHIHQCLVPFGLFVACHARLLGKTVVGTDLGGGETQLYQAHPFLFENFDFLHAISDFASSSYTDATVPIPVIKGPVDDRSFQLLPMEGRDPHLFISIGRILPHKGYENLIDMLPDGCKLLIVGRVYDDEYYEFLKARIGNKKVEFESALDDDALAERMRRAGLYLHGSVSVDYRGNRYRKAELLGLAPLEGMLTGMPAICSDTAALHELGALQGCRTYRTTDDLGDLLHAYLNKSLDFPSAKIIRDEVVGHYGLEQFGRKYCSVVGAGFPCAS